MLVYMVANGLHLARPWLMSVCAAVIFTCSIAAYHTKKYSWLVLPFIFLIPIGIAGSLHDSDFFLNLETHTKAEKAAPDEEQSVFVAMSNKINRLFFGN